jgi:hypothetical protein
MKLNNLKKLLFVFILTLASLSASAQSYKGFVEAGYGLSFGDNSEDLMTISTTHGLQLNPKFFVGAGVAFEYGKDSKKNAVPFFLDGRFNLFNKPITPFVDLKFGYSFFQSAGYFINPTIGYRIGLGNKSALNVGVGYTHQHNTDEYYPLDGDYDTYYQPHFVIFTNNICLKIGYEF